MTQDSFVEHLSFQYSLEIKQMPESLRRETAVDV